MKAELAILGGVKAIKTDNADIFRWPIVTSEDEAAVLDVIRKGAMSGTDVTKQFENEFAAWQKAKYILGFNNGTAALQAAMYGCKVGIGDEIICPSITYWAAAVQVFSLGGTMVFADIDPGTLCIDPKDIENRISKRTKAIMVVHYLGHPADMDPIMEIANRHGLKVIEDVSHAQGGLYKGKKLGSIGHVGATSLMSGKSLVAGEGGMLMTDDREIYERAVSLGHYERMNEDIRTDYLRPYLGLPLGGYKYRMHQVSSAMGRVQLKYYDQRCVEIRKAMNYFWDMLEGVDGLTAHRVPEDSTSNMAGWYAPHGIYCPDELGGLSVSRFCEAVKAEGVDICAPGCNVPLHTHKLFSTCDVYGHGKPTRIANLPEDFKGFTDCLPVSEMIGSITYWIPWFKKFEPDIIEQYANAFIKVSENYRQLIEGDKGNPEIIGGWHLFRQR